MQKKKKAKLEDDWLRLTRLRNKKKKMKKNQSLKVHHQEYQYTYSGSLKQRGERKRGKKNI